MVEHATKCLAIIAEMAAQQSGPRPEVLSLGGFSWRNQ